MTSFAAKRTRAGEKRREKRQADLCQKRRHQLGNRFPPLLSLMPPALTSTVLLCLASLLPDLRRIMPSVAPAFLGLSVADEGEVVGDENVWPRELERLLGGFVVVGAAPGLQKGVRGRGYSVRHSIPSRGEAGGEGRG